MKIIKYSSSKDLERIAKYMINIMASSRIFDDEGNYLNQDNPSNGFPIFNIGETEYSIKSVSGDIYYTEGVLYKTERTPLKASGLAFLLEEMIIKLENKYDLYKLPWYNNKYKTVFNSMQTSIKIKTKKIDEQKVQPKKNNRYSEKDEILNKNFEIIDTTLHWSSNNGYAKFVWKLIPSEIETRTLGYCDDTEFLLQKHISSIFIDANDAISLKDNEFITFLQYEHFTAQNNTITAENITISPYGNPLLFYLNLEWRNAFGLFRNLDHYGGHGNYMFRKLLTQVYEAEYNPSLFVENNIKIDKCQNCRSMLFDDVYVLLSRRTYTDISNTGDKREELDDNDKKLVLCPLCLHLSLFPFECEYKYTLRTKIPVNAHDIIEYSVAPKPHKEALHVLAELTPIEIECINNNSESAFVLHRPQSEQGYVVAKINYDNNERDVDCRKVIRMSGYGGRKVIKINLLQ